MCWARIRAGGPPGSRRAANYAGKSAGWLFTLRGDHHDHLAALEARALLDGDFLAEIGLDALGHLQTQLLVRHFAPLEADVDLDLVAFLEKAAQVAQLDRVVAVVGGRTELEFLDLDDLLLLLGRIGLLLRLELCLLYTSGRCRRRG